MSSVHRPHRQTALPASELEESSGGPSSPISPVAVVVQEKAPPKQSDHKGAKCEFIQMKVNKSSTEEGHKNDLKGEYANALQW